MKEKHAKETALKAEREVLAKDAANKQAADLVNWLVAHYQSPVLHQHAILLLGLSVHVM